MGLAIVIHHFWLTLVPFGQICTLIKDKSHCDKEETMLLQLISVLIEINTLVPKEQELQEQRVHDFVLVKLHLEFK